MTLAEIGALLNFLIVIVLIYLALSLAASMLVEMLAGMLSKRGSMLKLRIAEMFDDIEEIGFARLMFQSPLLKSFTGSGRLPSYVASEAFAQAVIAVIKEHRIVDARDLPPVLRAIAFAEGFGAQGGDLEKYRAELENWYDRAMDRLSGSYKRWSRRWLFMAGLALAVGLNINLIDITKSIWSARFTLEASVQQIEGFHAKLDEKIKDGQTAEDILEGDEALRKELAQVLEGDAISSAATLPIGWTISEEGCEALNKDLAKDEIDPDAGSGGQLICSAEDKVWSLLNSLTRPAEWSVASIIGWLLSALLVIPGANFWFDILGKLISLRAAGVKPQPAGGRQNEQGGPS